MGPIIGNDSERDICLGDIIITVLVNGRSLYDSNLVRMPRCVYE